VRNITAPATALNEGIPQQLVSCCDIRPDFHWLNVAIVDPPRSNPTDQQYESQNCQAQIKDCIEWVAGHVLFGSPGAAALRLA
jgi:hypothetical protein